MNAQDKLAGWQVVELFCRRKGNAQANKWTDLQAEGSSLDAMENYHNLFQAIRLRI
jgi:hypothetical protein